MGGLHILAPKTHHGCGSSTRHSYSPELSDPVT